MNQWEFEERVCRFMKEKNMVSPGDGVLVGVSGGADSVALLRLLWNVRQRLAIEVRCVHVEHGIRGEESLRDQRFVEALCEELGIVETSYAAGEQITRERPAHISLEEQARNVRYDYLLREAKAWEAQRSGRVVVALAHHSGDNAETVLFHLVRGTGLDGMRGIPVCRDRIIRPFLRTERQEIERYLAELQQPFCQDSTNADLSYDRNGIRHQVLPLLTGINSRAVPHIAQTAELLGEVADYINDEAERLLAEARGTGELHGAPLQGVPAFLLREVIHLWLSEYVSGARDISAVHINGVAALFASQPGHQCRLPEGWTVWRTYDGVTIGKTAQEKPMVPAAVTVTAEQLQSATGICVSYGDVRICFQVHSFEDKQQIPRNAYTKWFDYDKIKSNIQIRPRQSGDYLCVTSSGGHQRLQNYFTNQKVPAHLRDSIPLLCDDDHVIWVVGYRISEYYKVTQDTTRVLEVQILEEKEHE